MINFSVLIPSRGRKNQLFRLLDSIEEKSLAPKTVEVIVAIDLDDDEYLGFIKDFRKYTFCLKVVIRTRSKNINNDYYNLMARMSSGVFTWVLNDDCVIETKNWDREFLIAIGEFGKDIFYGDVSDSTRNYNAAGEYSCFPLLPRKVVEILGHFFHPEITSWCADKILKELFKGSNLILDLNCVHVHHHREVGSDSYNRMREEHLKNLNDFRGNIINVNLSEDRKKLSKFTGTYVKCVENRSCMERVKEAFSRMNIPIRVDTVTYVVGCDKIKYPIRRMHIGEWVFHERMVITSNNKENDYIDSKFYKKNHITNGFRVVVSR